MHDHGSNEGERFRDSNLNKVLLIGNPNVGKSALFGLLTGKYVTVSNYPGTTVEVTYGNAVLNKARALVIDTPGVNSLVPMSEDEKVTRDMLISDRAGVVVQVADTKNLRRGLLITLQLAEMEVPFILDLNMDDEAKSRGILVDQEKLSGLLGIEVVKTVAIRRSGIDKLMKGIQHPRKSIVALRYDDAIEDGVRDISALLPPANISRRALALMVLAGDESLKGWLHTNLQDHVIEELDKIRETVQSKFHNSLGYVINSRRIKKADEILAQVMTRHEAGKGSMVAFHLGRLSMHPLYGLPILFAVLYLVYQFVGVLGAGDAVGFLEKTVFGEYLNPWATKLSNILVPIPLIQELLVGEYGLITMALTYSIAIVLPIVGFFFIAFGILEDSGYLPRLAVMVNKIFKIMGLNGKAVLPMVLGLGCDTMATLTTRILETKKERILVTLLLALGVPCSAQLGVVLGMVSGISGYATAVWIGTVVLVMLLVGYLAAKAIPGEPSDFVLELPPIRVPQLSNILIKTLARVQWYLKEAVPLFILGTFILFVGHKLGALAYIQKMTDPLVVGILGLPSKAAEAFVIGFLRRDYGAAGLFVLAKNGMLDPIQTVVSLVVITLFVPCIANFFMMVKERGMKAALYMVAFIFPFAFAVGGALNWILRTFKVAL
ncbi:MAG TPA: ferrous iron transport protein B [Nitrospirota bacterium]|nr:ferrous iron transport protein B [Nitrospirota bacterium]